MDIKHLRIYCEVCRYESITEAAKSLNMNEPAVSLSIKQLEDYYGVKLFERMNRRLYITSSGQQLLGYAQNILSQFEESKNVIQNSDTLSSLKIGSNVYLGTIYLPKLIEKYKGLYPKIDITSKVGNTSEIEEMLLKNDLDVGLVDNISSQGSFKSHLILKENMIAVCGPNYIKSKNLSMTMEELSKEKLLLREIGSGTRDSVEQAFKAACLSTRPAMESISNSALIESAKHNLGILITSEKLVEDEIIANNLIPLNIEGGYFIRNYYVIYHKSKYLSNAMKNFIRLLDVNIY